MSVNSLRDKKEVRVVVGDRIEIIDADLMTRCPDKIRSIEYWSGIMDHPVGWHYWLDIVWILNNIEKAGLLPGAWIVDAGAGLGVLQYVLASRGYNVISLDYAERKTPSIVKNIFNTEERVYGVKNEGHAYRKFINYNKPLGSSRYEVIRKALSHPLKAARLIMRRYILPNLNINRWREIMNAALNGKRYGKIIFAKGDFTDLSGFGDKSVDCIVSLSALEHSDHEGIIRAVSQFDRILKDDGSMFLTISATDGEDWFFKPCRGWCFSEDTIRKIFGLDNSPSNYADYQKLFARLKASSEIRKRVDRFYYESGDNGLPWGIYDPKYQPVGIVKTKTRR